MKNIVKIIGIIALVALIGFSIATCLTLSPSGGTTSQPIEDVQTIEQGTLAIMGLDAYDGYYIYASGGYAGESSIVAAVDIIGVMHMDFMTGSEIKNGTVTLPVWRVLGYDYEQEDLVIHKERYTGNDSLELEIIIWSNSESYSPMSMSSMYSRAGGGFLSVTFINGAATGIADVPDPSSEYSIFER